MCNKSATYLHQKSAYLVLNIMLFDALVLILLTKFNLNCTFKRYSFGIQFLNYKAKFAPNINQICLISLFIF